MKSSKHSNNKRRFGTPKFKPTRLRIVSGELRGRKISYNGDPATRPMKERTRESVYSLLGGKLNGYWCVDLFGGTGILAFEAISRGADGAIIMELARPAVQTLIENAKALGIEQRVRIRHLDTLRWFHDAERHVIDWPQMPWVVFCCPPYALWTRESSRLCEGIRALYRLSPLASQFVCETDDSFDIASAIPEISWDCRHYSPATIAVAERTED